MPPSLNPFNQDHCDCFTRVAQQSGNLAELIDCLQECGIDMRPIKAQNDETGKIASNLKARFFPQET